MTISDDEIEKYVKSVTPDLRLHKANFTKARWCVENIRKGDIVIDAGACVGVFTRLYSDLVGVTGRVIAFEPETKNIKELSRNVNIGNVTIVHSALSDFDGEATLYVADSLEAHSLCKGYGKCTQLTKVTTLDTYCKENNITKINHIKTDLEGCDYLMLLGAKNIIDASDKLSIIGEWHWQRFGISRQDVFNFFTERNMVMKDVLKEFSIITDPEKTSVEMLVIKDDTNN